MNLSDEQKKYMIGRMQYSYMKGYNEGLASGLVAGMAIGLAMIHLFGVT